MPRRRIRVDEIAGVWQNLSPGLQQDKLLITERAVLGPDEDTNTLAVAAAQDALGRIDLPRAAVHALYLGTCTNPYDSRPSATLIAEALGLRPELMAADVQFSGKSGTAAIQISMALVSAGMADTALAIGADTINRHVAPGELYEATASAGAAAFVISSTDLVAEIEASASISSDLSDFFRLEGERYIKCAMGLGATTWEVGYSDHIRRAVEALMAKLGASPKDYAYAVFQQPYGSTPYGVARALGFERDQVAPAVIADRIGDCGAASSLLALAHVFDKAKGDERVLLASYGFGAGSDAFSLRILPRIREINGKAASVESLLNDKIMTDYATAIKFEYKYLKSAFPLSAYL